MPAIVSGLLLFGVSWVSEGLFPERSLTRWMDGECSLPWHFIALSLACLVVVASYGMGTLFMAICIDLILYTLRTAVTTVLQRRRRH